MHQWKPENGLQKQLLSSCRAFSSSSAEIHSGEDSEDFQFEETRSAEELASQSWLPKEEHVRELLCVDPCCQICDAASLEIQQLLQTSPNAKTPHEHKASQLGVPFLTLAECEALECHLLERQVKLQWSLPAVFLRKTWSHMLCEPHGVAKTIQTSFSPPSREFSFPEHTRRLLEFHLQKHLIYLHWGLPQRILHSIHSLLPSTDQQSGSCSSPQPGHPEANGSGNVFALAGNKGSISTRCLFSQTKAVLKNHIDSKCEQIHQGKVPAQVWSPWNRKIPGTLAAVVPFTWIPQGQHLELQAESKSNPDLHHEVVPLEAVALDQEEQASSGALIEHCKRPQALSKETIKKLETTLRHKYLAFLSGLPALYCVALSRPISPAVTSQPRTTEMMSRPVKSSPEARTQRTSLEGPFEPCTGDDNKACVDTTGEVQPEAQVGGKTEKAPLESQTHGSPCSLNAQILTKLNFHLTKKVLAKQFGISEKEKECKGRALASSGRESIQEFLRSLGIPEGTALLKLPSSGDSPPAPDANTIHLKKQPATAVCHKPGQPSSRAVSHGSAQRASKASKLRDKMEAQMNCVQMETSREKPNLEKPFSPRPQSPGKSKSSAHVPTLTEESKEPGKPKAVGDLGERSADLRLSMASKKTHHDGDQEPEKRPLHRSPQGSSQQRHSFHLEDPCLPSPQSPPKLEFPESPPKVFMKRKPERGMQDSQTKTKGKTHVEPMVSTPGKAAKTSKENADKTLPQAKSPTQKTKTEACRGPKVQSVTSEKSVIESSLTAPRISDSSDGGGQDCCLKYSQRKIPYNIVRGYRKQEPSLGCPIPAILFSPRKRNQPELCANPEQSWVQKLMRRLDQPPAPGQQGSGCRKNRGAHKSGKKGKGSKGCKG
ncbi:hypothetical protein STEG23_017680, partial [Scotinomys teguina]